jgi:hypothetical protein
VVGDDVAQLTFEVCDGVSVFTNEAYASLDWGATAAAALRTFDRQIHGGLFTLEAGEGGSEYASGSFRVRFHYYKPNQLLISTIQEGDFFRLTNSSARSRVRKVWRRRGVRLYAASIPQTRRVSITCSSAMGNFEQAVSTSAQTAFQIAGY